jgi:hypothetical protein
MKFVPLTHIEVEHPEIYNNHIPMLRRLNWIKQEDGHEVITDLTYKVIIKMNTEKVTFRQLNDMLSDIVECTVCGEVLFPDDEAYVDKITNETLCDRHSTFNEAIDGYVMVEEENVSLL